MKHTVKILGTGCSKCQNLTKVVTEVIAENHLDASVEKVEDIMDIMQYKVMLTPALVVDEKVVMKGRIPSKEEVLVMLQ